MGRIRSIKPDVGKHELLFDLEKETGLPIRFAWVMLWTACDREGRFRWRPRQLKPECLPYDDLDFAQVLDVFWKNGFVTKYRADGTRAARVDDASATGGDASSTEFYGCIPTWKNHQYVNHRESASVLPPPTIEAIDAANNQLDLPGLDACGTREPRVTGTPRGNPGMHRGEGEGEREGEREVGITIKPSNSSKGLGSGSPTAAVSIPLNDKSEFQITAAQIQEWQGLYPATDVLAELLRMRQWSLDHPKRRKTKRGIVTHITGWLSDEQDKGGRRSRDARVGMSTPAIERAAQAAVDAIPTLDTADLPDAVKNSPKVGEAAWNQISKVLSKKINKHSFDTWIKPLRGIGVDDKTLYVAAPNDEFATMAARYGDVIFEVAAAFNVADVRFRAVRV